MQFRLLGPVEVIEGERPLPLGGPKQRAVLAHLLLRANQVVSTDVLIEQVWGDEAPEAAKNSLQSYVSHLRKALGPGRLEGRAPGYVLRVELDEVDAVRFESLLREARSTMSSEPERAASVFEEALSLWRGSPIADLAEEPTLRGEIARLEELRLSALEDRVEARLALGQHEEVVPELETVVTGHPLRERVWAHLMLALYRSGRQADALAAYQRARQVLADELGIDPSPELQRLQEQILRQDPALQPGVHPLRGYRLLERVGEGAFGVVWRATQPQVGREVAVKAVHAHLANRPEFIRSFESEAQLVARLEHPHIVPLYDYWRDPDGAYLVMRYLRGGSLKRALADGPIEPEWAGRIVDQVARALSAAHRQGVVHRDVKPSNILLDEEGGAYLADFGIAADLTSHPDRGPPLPYRSPEVSRGEPAGPRSDTYSLAVVAFEALTGRRPPASPLSTRAVRPELSPALDEVLATATADDPDARYGDPGEFADALVRALRVPAAVEPRRLAEVLNPYKGLRAFTEADAPDFFGRENLTAQLLARLGEEGEGSRLLAVVGPSGSGKSSVVRAGVVPALREGALRGSADWFFVDMTPGRDPFAELEAALRKVAVDPPAGLLEELKRDEAGLVRSVDGILPGERTDLLLVVDQFEEVFTLVDDEEVRARFLSALATAVQDPRSRLRVLLTLRGDFYDRPLSYPGFGDVLAARTQAVPPMLPEELERAISGPADRAGVACEAGLMAEVLAEVSGQPGSLPLVQYAFTELFEGRRDSTLTLSAYRQIGGASGAVARRAEQLYGALNDAGRQAVRQLFLRLVTPGDGTEDTRRRVPGSELTSLEVDRAAMEGVIDTFGRHRLLSFDRDPETREPTVEVAHEALLTSWGRLRGFIDQARDDLRTHRRLARSAAEWNDSSRDQSFLLRGARLAAFESWAGSTGIALAPREREYLDASVAEGRRVEAEEHARRERERALERRSLVRLRALVAVLAVTALVASGLTVFAFNQRGTARREATRAEQQARLARARELASAAAANVEANPELGLLLALEAAETTHAVDGTVLPEAEQVLHQALNATRVVLSVPGNFGVAFSPDGRHLATNRDDGTATVWEVPTGKEVLTLSGHSDRIMNLIYSFDGSRIATASADSTAKIWNSQTGKELLTLIPGPQDPSGGPSEILLSPAFGFDGAFVATTSLDCDVPLGSPGAGCTYVWDGVTGEQLLRFLSGPGLAFSPVENLLATSGTRAVVRDVPSGKFRFQVGLNVVDVAFGPAGRLLAVAESTSRTARVVDVRTGKELLEHSGHAGTVEAVDFSPDGKRLATGSGDGTARVWDLETGETILVLTGQGAPVENVDFSPDGELLVGGSSGGTALVWGVTPEGSREILTTMLGPPADFYRAAYSPDGTRFVVTSFEGTAKVIDATTGKELLKLPHSAPVLHALFSPDGTRVATANVDGTAKIWDAETGNEVLTLAGHSAPVSSVAFDRNGSRIATAGVDGVAKVWDPSTGAEILTLTPNLNVVFDVAFSPDGSRLVTTHQDDRAKLWDATGKDVASLQHSNNVFGVAFSPDGTRIATGSGDGKVKVWDAANGREVFTLSGHKAGVFGVAFSPDGKRVASASADRTAKIWDVATGREVLTLSGHTGDVSSVAYSSDGNRLLTASADGTARIYELRIEELIKLARDRLTRGFTEHECRQYLHVERCPSGA